MVIPGFLTDEDMDMKQIKTEADWYDALEETGPFNRPGLDELLDIAERRGWRGLASELRYDLETLDRAEEMAARNGKTWSGCPEKPRGGVWGVFGRK